MDLLKEIKQVVSNQQLARTEKIQVTKYMLALDAAKQINKQIVRSNDLFMLMDLVLFTLAGQFGITNAFILFYNPDEPGEQPVYLGLGECEHSVALDNPDCITKLSFLPLGDRVPIRIHDLEQTAATSDIKETLLANDIKLLMPMCNEDRIFGFVGMGHRVSGKPISDEDAILLAAIVDIISPIMSRRSDEFFGVFHSSAQAVIILAPDFTIQKINKTAMEFWIRHINTDQKVNSILGHALSEMFPAHIFPGWIESVTKLEPNSNVSHIRNLELIKSDKTLFFEAFVTKINSRFEHTYSLILTLDDVTEKVAVSRRLAEMHKAAEKGRILSSIAHELNNYLGLIVGGLDLAAHAAKTGNLEKIHKHIENAKAACESINRFASELVGKRPYKSRKSPSNLNVIIKQCIEFVKTQKRFQQIDLQLQLAEDLPLVLIDEDEICQLLINTTNNAADAINDIRDSGTVQIRTYSGKHCIILEVEDDGPGIPPEVKKRLFKENLTTKSDGHGFGLTVSAQILKNHNAQFHVNTELGKGSIFKFSFPVIQ